MWDVTGSDINCHCKTFCNDTYANGMQQKEISLRKIHFLSATIIVVAKNTSYDSDINCF
jgi:hypothetical protein